MTDANPTIPLLEYDPARDAIIEPHHILRRIDIPETCVLCFFQEVIKSVCLDQGAKVITHLGSEMGTNPVYELDVDGQRIAVTHPGVGAPLSAGFLEELIALGCRKFIACGGSGVLKPEITVGHVVIPESAVRDEGTSYHYLPPSREVSATPEAVQALRAALEAHHVPYVVGKTWTTDGLYRETRAKIARRKAEGCITVEMEAAAFFAVAQFRGIPFGQILYAGDDISGDSWNHRNWKDGQTSTREKLFWLAAEAVLKL
ncbi:MAG: nucleoside phosphorylase [Anaerolineae bacterium]|nr:nucleoside phosphorylase [Anaerolineae bacterium]